MRYASVITGGFLAGLAGVWLTLEQVGTFQIEMTTGRGFIALAALIFGRWTPFGAFGAALIFGAATTVGVFIPNSSTGSSPISIRTDDALCANDCSSCHRQTNSSGGHRPSIREGITCSISQIFLSLLSALPLISLVRASYILCVY